LLELDLWPEVPRFGRRALVGDPAFQSRRLGLQLGRM